MNALSPRRSARLAQAQADITEVEAQLEDGDLDEATAQRLVARYRLEIESLAAEPDAPPAVASSSRRIVGALVLVGALVAVAVVAFGAIRPRQGGFVTGDTGGVDLDSVTNDQMEAVIAANADIPQVGAMRSTLADRYFDESDFQAALPHYLAALEGQLDSPRRARALARIGWMTFVTGISDVAESYLLLSLEIDPGYDEAHLFLGLVLLEGCRPAAALDQLTPLASDESVPVDIRTDIDVAIARAEELLSAGACP